MSDPAIPTGFLVVAPMTVGVGEAFDLKVKVLGRVHPIPSACFSTGPNRRLRSQFNLAPSRNIQYLDNVLPEWSGVLEVRAKDLAGPRRLRFDGRSQGVYEKDHRPIKTFAGFRWKRPGVHWIEIADPAGGAFGCSHPVVVTERPPRRRLWWGDPHSQTFFSDGIRCPEELYVFAREEAFLDFFAVTDHVEPLTDRQWEYFVAVTNDFNAPGRFATLVGLEWTSKTEGHRNVYYRGSWGEILRSSDERSNSLPKLWRCLAGHRAVVVPHHSANVEMGVPWTKNRWNSRYERLVEIYSVWGNSELPASRGNPRPIRTNKGEKDGQHVQDALGMGFQMGFCGGGDIHDGRPGDELHSIQDTPQYPLLHEQGLTAVISPRLTRPAVWDAFYHRRTYASSKRRSYVHFTVGGAGMGQVLRLGKSRSVEIQIQVAATAPLKEVMIVKNGQDWRSISPAHEPRIAAAKLVDAEPAPGSYYYVRATTEATDLAWSSPVWIAK